MGGGTRSTTRRVGGMTFTTTTSVSPVARGVTTAMNGMMNMLNMGGGTNMYEEKIYTLSIVFNDASCGCVGCVNSNYITPPPFFPSALQGYITNDDLLDFIDDVNGVYKRTVCPMFPLIFLHFCLPFSPICFASCAASNRKKGLTRALRDFNTLYAEKGLYARFNLMGTGISFCIDKGVREAYIKGHPEEAKNMTMPSSPQTATNITGGQSTPVATPIASAPVAMPINNVPKFAPEKVATVNAPPGFVTQAQVVQPDAPPEYDDDDDLNPS